jgi:hypothetical protein
MRLPGLAAAASCALVLFPCAARAQAAGEPLHVTGVRVVFFGPSRAERDSIARDEGLEIDDLLDDFNYSAGKAAVFLSRAGIPSEFTESRIVIVKTGGAQFRTFDRKSIPDPVGMILTDGFHEPRVVPGRGTDRDLLIEIRDYFHLGQ